jgi:micrococcal nuclease
MPLTAVPISLQRQMKIIKRVLLAVPFFLSPFSLFAQATCDSEYYDETVKVRAVIDGDTLLLVDGRKLRIIGINTPELSHEDRPAEPYARQATKALSGLLKNQHGIHLRHGAEKQDRYHRLLAHVFLPDGQNISQLMLEQGMGLALTVPPNLWALECYRHAEQKAQQQHLGVWQLPRFQAIETDSLEQQRGYYRVRGTVTHIGESHHAYWLNMSDQFALKIAKKDLQYFTALPVKQLEGRVLVARGWIYPSRYKNKAVLRMQIRHPAMLDVVK